MNILVSNYDNSGENVMIFTDDEQQEGLSATTVEKALKSVHKHFDDVYAVRNDELQYYLYEPLWATDQFIRDVKARAHGA